MILHVDMDAFYASVEMRERPELVGLPVIVGGDPQSRGVVSAASYEARRFGVHSAMPMREALRRCPDAICLRPRMSLYSEVSHDIHAIFARYSPQIEPLALDEAFLDVTASERLFGGAETIARRIKQEIRGELGLVASVGVAPNKYVAKLASDIQKPDGFVVVSAETMVRFLEPLPVSRLWGAGMATLKIFERLGIRTIGEVSRQSTALMTSHFGKAGAHFLKLARGEDDRAVVSDRQAKSISHETTFATDVRDTQVLQSVLLELTEQVAWRLRRYHLRGRTVQLKLRYDDFRSITRSQTLETETDVTSLIWQSVLALFQQAMRESTQPIRLIGIGMNGLQEQGPAAVAQLDMFSGPGTVRQHAVDAVADSIKNRFGKHAIRRGGSVRDE